MLTKSNAVSYAVLALIINGADDEQVRELHIEPYLNGRESGFAVHFWNSFRASRRLFNRKFVFTRCRNSDSIVVYESDDCGFSMQGNTPTEEVYRASKLFNGDDVVRVANYVLMRLTEISSLK